MLKQLLCVLVLFALFYQNSADLNDEDDIETTTFEPYPDCPSVDPSGSPEFFEDPNDCSSYYECSNGQAIHFQCPVGTYFEEKVCKWAYDVDCGFRPTTITTGSPEPSTDSLFFIENT